MKLRLSFSHTSDELFLVTAVRLGGRAYGAEPVFTVTPYDHEDTFLGFVMQSSLAEQAMFDTVQGVLLAINRPTSPQRWVELDLDRRQVAELRLEMESLPGTPITESASGPLYDLFMQAPTPLMILMGPEHRYRFINPLYLELMGRTGPNALGRTVREVYPEMKGQPFFGLLDTVYRTGVPFVGKEVPCRFLHEETGEWDDRNFDFIYQPIRDAVGEVEGIMVQATDVTLEVLARQVSAERETQLFRQWTELEAIYQAAPVGLSLVDAGDFRFLRANQRLAEMIGCEVKEIVGRSALTLGDRVPGAHELFERAALGERQEDIELEGELATQPGVHRSWRVSATPLFDAGGVVSAITVAATETTAMKRAEARLLEAEAFVAGGLMAESFVRTIAGPVEELKALLATVRGEIHRTEALTALAVAEEKLQAIADVTSDAARRYGVKVAEKVVEEVESGGGR